MTKVSKNELILLVVMMIGIVLYLSYYFVKIPLDEQYDAAEAEVRAKEAELLEVQTKISTKESLESTYEEAVVELEKLKGNIKTYMYDEDVDNRLVSLMEENGMVHTNTTIMNDAGRLVASEIESITYKGYTVKTYGTAENLYSFLDTLYEQTDLAVISVTINRESNLSEEELAAIEEDIELECILNIVVCMGVEEEGLETE